MQFGAGGGVARGMKLGGGKEVMDDGVWGEWV